MSFLFKQPNSPEKPNEQIFTKVKVLNLDQKWPFNPILGIIRIFLYKLEKKKKKMT